MRNLFVALVIACIILRAEANASVTGNLRQKTYKVINTSWVEQGALKWGMIGSFCAYQALNGMVEGYHFRQEKTNIINGSNYHMYATAQRTAGIVTGWFAYALFKDKKYYTPKDKIKIAIASGLWGRNAMEWSYKTVRYGNAFNYSEAHNKHALVYFGIRDGKIADMYIGTGKYTGPVVDIAFAVAGALLLRSASIFRETRSQDF